MRTLSSAFLAAVLCLAVAGAGTAQQSPANPENSSSVVDVANSPCRVEHDADKIVRVKEGVTRGLLIHKVNPSYPRTARNAHIEGTVMLCAAISKEGTIENLRAVSGPPELIPSSIKAVKKWHKTYLVAGEPVEVETEIRVNYALTR